MPQTLQSPPLTSPILTHCVAAEILSLTALSNNQLSFALLAGGPIRHWGAQCIIGELFQEQRAL